MKILITGGAGFIGSHLIDRLLSENHEVICIDNFDDFYDISEKKNNISNHFSFKNYTFHEGDITDKIFIKDIISSDTPEIIIHLAARAGVRPSIINPEKYYEVNVSGTLTLLETLRNIRIKKFIYASSSSVYGLNPKTPFSEEDATMNPASPYAASKIAGEALCHSFNNIYGINTLILRFFTVYGSRQRPDLAIRKFIRSILNKEVITMFGNGGTSRDYTHISDIVSGIIKTLDYDRAGCNIFNLGNSNPIKLIELIHAIEKHTGEKAILRYMDEQKGDVPITYADISKAKRELGYDPAVSLDEGIKEMIVWLKNLKLSSS
ncbi:MAG: GDP-mannose 4,6-dehydratase [Bacteroidia bacterium]|nr:GDP-mannose 4,6-dehydratase [Bacteroidia bacterium]